MQETVAVKTLKGNNVLDSYALILPFKGVFRAQV